MEFCRTVLSYPAHLAGAGVQFNLLSWWTERRPNSGPFTPGVMIGKISFSRESNNRLAFIFGAGMQIATSEFHSYNHAVIATGRISF